MSLASSSNMIQQITVVGGTHGNEWLGPVLIEKLENKTIPLGGFLPVSTLLANPVAFQAGVRFIDKDLNRCFTRDVISGCESFYEHLRAREIYQQVGNPLNKNNFIIDLHSTTSAMGLTVIVCADDKLSLKAAAYVQQHMPRVKLILSHRSPLLGGTLNSITGQGMTIEVGALPNNAIRHDLLDETENIIRLIVEYIEHDSRGDDLYLPDQVFMYQIREKVSYPQVQGKITGYIHKDFEGRDFQLLKKGDCIFFDLSGKVYVYEGKPGYSVFINEVAYYFEKVAFIMTDKVKVTVP